MSAVPGAKGPRMCRAVVDLGGDIMRDILYQHVKPAVVMSYVLASRYYRNHPLNTHQMSVLGNASVRGDYNECDITLVYSLVRNLSPTSTHVRPTAGWGKPVSAGDTTLGDDVERIRDIRNTMYGHIATTSLPDSTYNHYMQVLYDICHRMDTVHAGSLSSPAPRPQTYCQILGDIQTCCMDPNMEVKYLSEIRRMKQMDQATRDLIEAVKKDAIDTTRRVSVAVKTVRTKQEALASHLDSGLLSVRTQQETLTSHVETIDMELTSLKTRQSDLNDRLDRDLTTLRNQRPDAYNRHVNAKDKAAVQEYLVHEYRGAISNVQVMPLNEGEGLPLPQIYGSVLVEEDVTALKKTKRPDEPITNKTLDSITDMFYVRNKLARRIFLTGEPGHGKTFLCLKFIDTWSKCKIPATSESNKHDSRYKNSNHNGPQTNHYTSVISRIVRWFTVRQLSSYADDDDDDKLRKCLAVFDMVFYVPLRNAKQGVSSIADLVCDSVSGCDQKVKQNIRQILSDGSILCLVVLDGLDEWRAPDTCRVQGFPDSDGLVNCSLLCTMRPWRMINLRLGLGGIYDKVVQILGLKEDSIESVISNVLVNFYGIEISSDVYKIKLKRFSHKAKHPELESLAKIPLMLTASCLLWNEEDDVSIHRKTDQATHNFMTLFYLKLQEMMITRAENKHDIVKSFLVDKRQNHDISPNIPSILSGFDQITDFYDIIIPVGRLALQDLVSEEPHLVFPNHKLERELGQTNLELALKVGILSQAKAPGLSYQQRVSVSFNHKSIQEFVAALVIASRDSDAFISFCEHCNTVDTVMELADMIMFVCGLDPVIGCKLSEHVKNIVNNDEDINHYREGGDAYVGKDKAEKLYGMQCKWFCEMKHNLSLTHNTDNTPTLHVDDIYLGMLSNNEDVSVASEILSREDNSIVSVYLDRIKHPIQSIINYLQGCKHLVLIHIIHITDSRDMELLSTVLPKLISLQCVGYGYGEKRLEADTAMVHAAQQLPVLTCIKLMHITLTDAVTLPSPLQKLVLHYVYNVHFILRSLPRCYNLTSLHISCLYTMDDCDVMASVLPQLHHLQYIRYDGEWSSCAAAGHVAVVSALQHITQLSHIELCGLDLGDSGALHVTPHMTHLQKVELTYVKLSSRKWMEFVYSLFGVQQTVNVMLHYTNIDYVVVDTIRRSSNITVTEEDRDHSNNNSVDEIVFCTVR